MKFDFDINSSCLFFCASLNRKVLGQEKAVTFNQLYFSVNIFVSCTHSYQDKKNKNKGINIFLYIQIIPGDSGLQWRTNDPDKYILYYSFLVFLDLSSVFFNLSGICLFLLFSYYLILNNGRTQGPVSDLFLFLYLKHCPYFTSLWLILNYNYILMDLMNLELFRIQHKHFNKET